MPEKFLNFLNYSVFEFNERSFTVIELLAVPLWLLLSIWVAHLGVKFVGGKLKGNYKDPNLVHLIERILYVIAFTSIFLTTLSMLNVPITAFAFLSGAVAIGFGFGAQNIINNFISGWILMGEKPIRIGDFLEVEGVKGTVEQIKTRSTRVRRVDGVHMLIPNSTLLENTVINWTLRDKLVRGTVSVGVAYGSDCKKVKDIIMGVTLNQKEVLTDPIPAVFFQDFGDSALIFEVYFWIHSQVEGGLRLVGSNIRFGIDEAFRKENIVISYPQRDVHIDGCLTLHRRS